MTNYNDGKWHGWNGGECPVHPLTTVSGLEENGDRWTGWAKDCDWPSFRGAFRVIREHREPREFWIVPTQFHPSGFSVSTGPDRDGIHVREVIEE